MRSGARSQPAVSFSITTYPAVAALTCHHSSPIRRPPCRADLTIRRVSQPCSISNRIYAYLPQGEWFRKASNVGVVTLGYEHYTLGQHWAKHEVQVTFDPADRCLVFLDHDPQHTKRLPIKGISYAELAGDMSRPFELHPYQLALPLAWSDARVTRLYETLTGKDSTL